MSVETTGCSCHSASCGCHFTMCSQHFTALEAELGQEPRPIEALLAAIEKWGDA